MDDVTKEIPIAKCRAREKGPMKLILPLSKEGKKTEWWIVVAIAR
jgi:hypothetical protein